MHSFGGVGFHHIDDIPLHLLTCRFSFDDGDAQGVGVASGGNWRGCPEHDEAEYEVHDQHDALDREGLSALLDRLEQQVRAEDPRELIEYRFFGPCGETMP